MRLKPLRKSHGKAQSKEKRRTTQKKREPIEDSPLSFNPFKFHLLCVNTFVNPPIPYDIIQQVLAPSAKIKASI